jgi:uncharacterized protein (DUF427 family)
MGKSPGHQQHPEHRVQESRLASAIRVTLDGEVIAESGDVIRVDEDGHPSRYYFPRNDVCVAKLERSERVTNCPFKGRATYYDIEQGGHRLKDAVWSYEDPYDEHVVLKGRLAFHDDEHPNIQIIEASGTHA